jgi:hypothetical protein
MPLNSQFFLLLPDDWIGHAFGGSLAGKSFLPILLGAEATQSGSIISRSSIYDQDRS